VVDLAGERELIPVGILEDGDRSPGLILGFLGKGNALGLEDFGGGEDVVAPEGNGLEFADALLVTLGREKRDAGFRRCLSVNGWSVTTLSPNASV